MVGEQGDQRVPGGLAEAGGNQQGAGLVAVQGVAYDSQSRLA